MHPYKVSAVFVLSVLAVAYFAVREYYQRPLERRCYEFTVAFEAEGNDYVLRTPITVQVFPVASFVSSVSIVTRPKVAAQRLPSGAGIFFNVPFHGSSVGEDLTEVPGGPDELPYAFWLDDVRDPSRMEAYYSEHYYQQPSPRLRIKALSKRYAECSPVDPGDEIPWLSRPREERFLESHYAHIVPEQTWSKIPALARTLEQVSVFQRLPDEIVADLRVLSAWPPRWGGDQDTIKVAGRRPSRVISDSHVEGFLRPIVRDGDHFRLLEGEEDAGMAIYYPDRQKSLDRLRIGDREVEIGALGKWHYDPVRRNLMKISDVTF